jgi:hypothetical protein
MNRRGRTHLLSAAPGLRFAFGACAALCALAITGMAAAVSLPHATLQATPPASGSSKTKDSGSKDSGSKDSGSQGSGSKDSGSKDSGSKDSGSRDSGATPSPSSRTSTSDAALDAALRARDFTEIDRIVSARVADGRRDPTDLYNGACALAQLGREDEAEKRLLDAVKSGFRDFDAMEADPDLEPIRASRTYEAIMEARERVERTPAPRTKPSRAPKPDPLAVWREAHGDDYRYEIDGDRGLAYATFLEEASHARMKETLDALGAHLVKDYFGRTPEDPVLIAIVRPEDARKYLEREEIKGMYLHESRRLVARDTGQSLQHEFVHLLHFAHMERSGQRHPIWIQEGLASLYENYTIRADGSVEFQPNIRFNIARKQVVSKTVMPWKELFALRPQAFMSDAERLYPQVRAIFEFIAREGKLVEFYKALCATSQDDPDGSSAIERTFGVPLAKVEERWKKWMIQRGAIDDSVSRRDASLGLTAEDAGDGVRIRSFVLKSAAKAAGLRVGDVIFAIDGVRVSNREELVLAVARLDVGKSIRVDYRRDGNELSTEVSPRPLGE